MKRYKDFKVGNVPFTKYKIVVPTEEDREEVQAALKHCHDSCDVDTEFVTVNQLVHEYVHGDESDKYSNVIVDPKAYKALAGTHK